MKKLIQVLLLLVPAILFSQAEFNHLFDIQLDDFSMYRSNLQLIDFDADGVDDIVISGEIDDQLKVIIFNNAGEIIFENQYEIETNESFNVTKIYKTNSLFYLAILLENYYLKLKVFDIISSEIIFDEIIDYQANSPIYFSELFNLNLFVDVKNEQIDYYITIYDFYEVFGGGTYTAGKHPFILLYSYQDNLEFVTYFEHASTIFPIARISFGTSTRYSELNGNSYFYYTSWLHTIDDTIFPPILNELFEIDQKIQIITLDEEICNELGIVYSFWDDDLVSRKFICISPEIETLWTSEYSSLEDISSSINFEYNGTNNIMIIGESKIIIFNHQTGELLHSENLDISFDKIRKSQDGFLYFFDYEYQYQQSIYHVYGLNSLEFQVSTGNELIHFKNNLSQNFPNPFNPTTTICYQLTQDTHVLLQIFNVKGQLIQTLINAQQIRGNQSFIWDATGQSSGIYFYRLKTDNFEEISKCLLIK